MASAAFQGLFNIQESPSRGSQPAVASPPVAHQKVHSEAPAAIELDRIAIGKRYNGHSDSGFQTPTDLPSDLQDPITPMTPNELEMSRPPTPKRDEAIAQTQRWNSPSINKWRLLSCCLTYFVNGISDSATGALIPYMEEQYDITYSIVSLIFVGQAIGFVVAAFFNNTTLHWIGRAKMLMIAEAILLLAYIILVCSPPYPLVVIAFFFLGYGAAMTLALNNVFCANLDPSTAVLGAAHGSYGIGGIVAPIAATAMVSRGIPWPRFYFIPLVLSVVCMASSGYTFWSYIEYSQPTLPLLSEVERTATRQTAVEQAESKLHDLKLALKNRVTIFGALFIFAYQGAEVSISGWVITFLIKYRGGDPASVGYVTAGFWGGITMGRFVLTHFAPKIGEKTYVVILILGTMAFQLLAWLIPNVIGNAVAVAIIGLLLGPVYPCGQTIFARLLPRHVQTTAIGFIAGAGSSGGAVAPFTTGILAQAVGTYVLHPVCIAMYVVMLACWFALPRIRKRTE